jgi:divalent metal cation (Fe/Co/Zn/Cd) transporter
MAEPTIQTTIQPLLRRSPERESLERRARMLAWGGIAYHFVEFAIAIGAGIAASFFILAVYVAVESIRTLVGDQHPEASWVEIGLAAFTTVTMPLIARVKRRVGNKLGSAATVKEASQTQLCANLSVALLIGLVLNAVAGLWWPDPLAALFIAGVAVAEGRESWRGEGCAEGCC